MKSAGFKNKLERTLAISISVLALLYASGFFRYTGIEFLTVQYRALVLCLALVLAFLTHPLRKGKPRGRTVWLDSFLICISIIGTLYMVFCYNQILSYQEVGFSPLYEQVLGVMFMATTLEAVRRVVGWPMAVIVVLFVIFPFVGNHVPGAFQTRSYSLNRISQTMFSSSSGIFGLALGISVTVIISFLIFGQFLLLTDIGKFFTDLAFALLGHVRGGPAKVAVVASSFFGMFSGSSAANAGTTGVLTIPLMKKNGYKPHYAAAVEAVASNGGQLMPPILGAVAFLIAEFLSIDYADVVIASFFPGILYYIGLFVMVDLEAAKTGLQGLPRTELPSIKKVIKEGWLSLIPVTFLVILLLWIRYSPEKSAILSLIPLVLVSSIKKRTRLNLRRLLDGLAGAAKATLLIIIACAGAGLIIGTTNLTGLGTRLSMILVDMSGGNLLFLLGLSALSCFVLGMGVGTITLYIMLATLVAPAMVSVGVLPLAAHLFIFWWGLTSYITPPVCATTWITAAIADCDPWPAGWTAVKLGIVNLILPFLFVYNPALLLIGSPLELTQVVVTALIAIVALGAGISGYLFRQCRWMERTAMIGAAIALLWPSWIPNVIGVIVLLFVALWQVKESRLNRRRNATI